MIQELQKEKEGIEIEKEEKRQGLFIEYQKAGKRSIQSAKVMEQFLQENYDKVKEKEDNGIEIWEKKSR